MSQTREQVARLAAEGVKPAEIARRLGIAGPTVEYHLDRLSSAKAARSEVQRSAGAKSARRQIDTRERVGLLLEDGLSRAQIARELGLSKATVSYHARRLGKAVDARCARRYDWAAVQQFYDEGHSARDCQKHFGFNSASWHSAAKRGALQTRPAKMQSDEYFVAGVFRSRTHLKRRLLAEGLKQPACEQCGLTEWRGLPLSLALHHVNGDRYDQRVVNLELLCANCHSQTDTFSGRNRRRTRAPLN